jgi:hypothetical protein
VGNPLPQAISVQDHATSPRVSAEEVEPRVSNAPPGHIVGKLEMWPFLTPWRLFPYNGVMGSEIRGSGRVVGHSEIIVGMQALPPGQRPHVRVVGKSDMWPSSSNPQKQCSGPRSRLRASQGSHIDEMGLIRPGGLKFAKAQHDATRQDQSAQSEANPASFRDLLRRRCPTIR